MPIPIRMRVGVDWDNDGYINFGIPTGDARNMANLSPLLSGVGLYYSNATNVLQANTETAYRTDPPEREMSGVFTVGGVSRFSWGYKEGYGVANRLGNTQTIVNAIVPSTMCIPVTPSVGNWITVSFKVKQVNGSVAAALTPGFRYSVSATAADGTVGSDSFGGATSLSIGNWVTLSRTVSINPGANSYIRLVPQAQFIYAATQGDTFVFKDLFIHSNTGTAITIPATFNNGGANYLTEDITKYVLDLDWELGNSDIMERVPSNGTAMIVLNNDNKEFLPGNTASPYYLKMIPRRRVIIQRYSGSSWQDMWHGYIKSFKLVDGNPLEQRVRLECEQSIYNTGIEGVIFNPDDEAAITLKERAFNEVIVDLLQKNPLQKASLPYGWRIGASFLGWDTFLIDDAEDGITADPDYNETYIEQRTNGAVDVTITNSSHNRYKYVGGTWTDTDLAAALREATNSEYGWLFYKRNGKLRGFDRYSWRLPLTTPLELNMNSLVYSYVSSYGEDVRNSISVKWRKMWRPEVCDLIPPDFKEDSEEDDDDAVVDRFWKRKKNIPYRGDKNLKVTIERLAVWYPDEAFIAEHPMTNADGQPLDINALWARFNAGGPVPEGAIVYDYDPEKHKIIVVYGDDPLYHWPFDETFLYHSIIAASNTPASGEFWPNFYDDIPSAYRGVWRAFDDKRFRYRFKNQQTALLSDTYTVNPIMMRGLVNINDGEQTLTIRDSESIMKYGGVFGWEIQNSLYTDEASAGCVAQQMLLDYETSGVGISSFKMATDDRSSAAYAAMSALEVGTLVNLTESYLGLTSAAHMVVKESHNFSNGVWEAEFTVVDVSRYAEAQDLAEIANVI